MMHQHAQYRKYITCLLAEHMMDVATCKSDKPPIQRSKIQLVDINQQSYLQSSLFLDM